MTDQHMTTRRRTSDGPRKPRARVCLECGAAFTAERNHGEFCGSQCRTAFNNRRRTRGALLYDMYMANRYEREEAKAAGMLKVMSRLDQEWRAEDITLREGRKSWGNWKNFLADFGARLNAMVSYDATGKSWGTRTR